MRLKVHGEECAAESSAGFRAEQLRGSQGEPHEAVGFLALDRPKEKANALSGCYFVNCSGQAYSKVRHYGGTPIFSHRFYANL